MQVNKINQKLKQLEDYISNVYLFRNEAKKEFLENTKVELGAERAVEKACQCALDIAGMLIANLGLKTPSMYRSMGPILKDASVISPKTSQKMVKIARFRNFLVHEYADLSPEEIYQIVNHEIDDLKEFASEVADYVRKNTKASGK